MYLDLSTAQGEMTEWGGGPLCYHHFLYWTLTVHTWLYIFIQNKDNVKEQMSLIVKKRKKIFDLFLMVMMTKYKRDTLLKTWFNLFGYGGYGGCKGKEEWKKWMCPNRTDNEVQAHMCFIGSNLPHNVG